jgi:hypothetical protein
VPILIIPRGANALGSYETYAVLLALHRTRFTDSFHYLSHITCGFLVSHFAPALLPWFLFFDSITSTKKEKHPWCHVTDAHFFGLKILQGTITFSLF